MKLFLKPDCRTMSIVRSKAGSSSPQKPTMKSLETATPGTVSRQRCSISL
jgi:hypothetical protein